MGRTKNTPKKQEERSPGTSFFSTVGEYIPIIHQNKKPKKRAPVMVYYQMVAVKEEHKPYFLGEIKVGSTSNVIPKNIQTCKISFQKDEKCIVLNVDNESVVVQLLFDISVLTDLIQSKIFSFEIYTDDYYVYFKVYLILPLPQHTNPQRSSKIKKSIHTVFKLFYNVEIPDKDKKLKSLSKCKLNHLYEKLIEKRDTHLYSFVERVHLYNLKPKLRKYQEEALQWMIYRETKATDFTFNNIHPLYQKITLQSGTDIYLDNYTGWVEKDPSLVQNNWKGGILADEMGLGKTVEILALILSNKFNNGSGGNCDSSFVKNNLDHENEEELTIRTLGKKRKLEQEEEKDYIIEKKSKIPEGFVKSSSKKSATYQALQTIYNDTLSKYSATKTRDEPEICPVQCVCGSKKIIDCIDCKECGKMQHKSCVGYNKSMGPYICPQCWEKEDPIESKATLIVAPSALRKQWCREIKTHLRAGLKVLNYEGYKVAPLYPTELQKYDIVVTTYNVLQAEIKFTETRESLNLRQQRKYWPCGSPLIRIMWWRLCLDEAQTVETPGRLVSLMAKKIPACHRWAVTGTPMAKGIADIFGLIDYLQMEPYNDANTWNHILYDPYVRGNTEPMYNFLSKVMWRTSKDSVLDQINIPQQTFQLHLLECSAVEKFFYTREHKICAQNFLQIASKFDSDQPLEKMQKRDLKILMAPLLSLRQACSDPSAVRGKGRYLSLKSNTSSMKDLLEALILKNKNDCEESLRLMVSSINGLAGIYLLMGDPEGAIREYRKVLQLVAKFSVEEKEGKLIIDKLPIIHAMHNLAEVLQLHPPKEYTLRDGSLMQNCKELEEKYIEKFMKETTSGKESCASVTAGVEKINEKFILNSGQWYSDGFDWVILHNLGEDLMARVEVAAANANVDCFLRMDTPRMMLQRAYNWQMDLEESRDALCLAMDVLYVEDPETKHIIIADALVKSAMDCHLRPQRMKGRKKIKCALCKTNDHLKNYESQLFTMKKRTEMFEDMGLVGAWKPRFEEILLKSLLSLLKAKNSPPDFVNDGETHVLLLEALKKEFKEIRKLWTLLDQQVCAQDELDICKARLQFKTTDEVKGKTHRVLKNLCYEQEVANENINLILPAELPHQEFTLRSEEARHNARLESLLGMRNYLGTLRQQQFEGYTPDPCPICRGPLVNTWAILSCAHTYCLDCFKTLLKNATSHIQCCVCRFMQNLQEVAYITSGPSADNQVKNEIQVLGNYSRKVENVVRLLLKLRTNDPHVKVLLFSTWSLALKLLKKALEQNDINCELADANISFEKHIENFKDPIRKITVLLLPVRLGSKGLNLIEATHVILLEPLLNPADELQAIGRVHRIGQTKPTVVHKFLVRNTIEESLHNATSANAAGWEKEKITVGQLISLFEDTTAEERTDNIEETSSRQQEIISLGEEIVGSQNDDLNELEENDVN